MRYEKQKVVRLLQENVDNVQEVNTMKCPMCGISEKHQVMTDSDGMKKPKCTGCGTVFFNPEISQQ